MIDGVRAGDIINDKPILIYTCDPEKNVDCRARNEKGWCGVECKHTFHKEFAKEEEE